mgnify:CR=1 FL=1
MAVTLTVNLTDSEQARILEIANAIAPNATPSQVKEWAEVKAKEGLRDAVLMAWKNHQQQKMAQDWPYDQGDPPPQQP